MGRGAGGPSVELLELVDVGSDLCRLGDLDVVELRAGSRFWRRLIPGTV